MDTKSIHPWRHLSTCSPHESLLLWHIHPWRHLSTCSPHESLLLWQHSRSLPLKGSVVILCTCDLSGWRVSSKANLPQSIQSRFQLNDGKLDLNFLGLGIMSCSALLFDRLVKSLRQFLCTSTLLLSFEFIHLVRCSLRSFSPCSSLQG